MHRLPLPRAAITRRALLRGAAAGLAVVSTHRLARAAGDPVVLTWAGYEVPEMWGGYKAKHDSGPSFTNFANLEEALLKVRSGFQADAVHPCVEETGRWVDSKAILPLDTSKLSHWGDLFDELKTQAGVLMNGQSWVAPVDWGNNSVTYRTDQVQVEEESYKMLFDERYAGKIAMQDDWPAVTFAGLALGYTNPYDMSDEQLAAAKALLVKQKPWVRFYWTAPAEVMQAMGAGEVVIASSWNDVPATLQAQGVPVKYAKPKEGIVTWSCGLSHLAGGAADPALVYDYIDAMLAPETGKFLIEAYGFGHSNKAAYKIADPKRTAALSISDPEQLFHGGHFASGVPEAKRKRMVAIMEEVKAGT